ncbi:MAG: winged helix-turn-helix domain-containing protein [FCB group bacterium]|nr:winged helix-turn-helix domain-containing protein [FCB group bacterium]
MKIPKKQPMKISQQQARRMFLHAQGLDGRTKFAGGAEGAYQVIYKLGYVQLDTIAVIQRAHHHTIWTRFPKYKPEMLDRLMTADHRVFEFWSHAASYLPLEEYRYYLPRMKAFREGKVSWAKYVQSKFGHLAEPVLQEVKDKGPVTSRDIEIPKKTKKGQWWNWNPIRYALEILFWRGDVMVCQRRNFQRVYDLTERVLPENVDTRMPDKNELGRFLVRRALSAYGTATQNEIHDHIYGADRKTLATAIADLVDAGEVVGIDVPGSNGKDSYTLTDTLEKTAKLRKNKPRLHLLSPFDNLITQRERTKRLFNFEYTLECYKPALKREYGYFVLPILWGDELIGRLDSKADRKKKQLLVRCLYLEPGFIADDTFLIALAGKLNKFAEFNDCDDIIIEKTAPKVLAQELRRYLKKT